MPFRRCWSCLQQPAMPFAVVGVVSNYPPCLFAVVGSLQQPAMPFRRCWSCLQQPAMHFSPLLELSPTARHALSAATASLYSRQELFPLVGDNSNKGGGGRRRLVGWRQMRGEDLPHQELFRSLETALTRAAQEGRTQKRAAELVRNYL
jgi:hypothetical protein